MYSAEFEIIVQTAVKNGSLLVITDFDEMHPMLNSLITYERIQSMSGEGSSIKIGSKTVLKAPLFRLAAERVFDDDNERFH